MECGLVVVAEMPVAQEAHFREGDEDGPGGCGLLGEGVDDRQVRRDIVGHRLELDGGDSHGGWRGVHVDEAVPFRLAIEVICGRESFAAGDLGAGPEARPRPDDRSLDQPSAPAPDVSGASVGCASNTRVCPGWTGTLTMPPASATIGAS
jgi:hypothetical protein